MSESAHPAPELDHELPLNQTPAAKRALAEAEQRRLARQEAEAATKASEIGGPAGPEPVRYGDWEKAASPGISSQR